MYVYFGMLVGGLFVYLNDVRDIRVDVGSGISVVDENYSQGGYGM